MRYDADKIYDLLPAVYRQLDEESGNNLYALISIIAQQAQVIEDDIENLYENWFIETCDEWVISYIASLMRVRGIHSTNESSYNSRAYVANTIRYRRAKGTLSVLEQLSRDITRWGNAKAVEFFQLVGTTQNFNHLRVNNKTVDLKDAKILDLLGTPFDTTSYTLDVKNISSNMAYSKYHIPGFYNIPNIGVYLWRLETFPAFNVPAFAHPDKKRFSFNPFGLDASLFNHPSTETGSAPLSQETDVACPIRRFAMYDDISYYYKPGLENFISINIDGNPIPTTTTGNAYDPTTQYNVGDIVSTSSGINYQCINPNYKPGNVPSSDAYWIPIIAKDNPHEKLVEVCNLANWESGNLANGVKVAIDPLLGRILFADPQENVYVNYNYGFSGKTGGGFYKRPISQQYGLPSDTKSHFFVRKNGSYASIQDAINKWDKKSNAIFEITDSERYDEDIVIILPEGISVEIRASQKQRPIIIGSVTITGKKGSKLVLDGLSLDTHDNVNLSDQKIIIVTPGDLGLLVIRHCTILPKKYLFSWDKVKGPEKSRLKDFLRGLNLTWLDSANMTVSPDGLIISTSSNQAAISLKTDPPTLSIKDPSASQNLISLDKVLENGLTNIYIDRTCLQVNNYNDDLDIIVEKTISGRIRTMWSLLILESDWANMKTIDDAKRLIDFLKHNSQDFDKWLDGTETMTNSGDVITITTKKYPHVISISKTQGDLYLKIDDKIVDEFDLRNETGGYGLYTKSESRIAISDSIIDNKGNDFAVESYSATVSNSTIFGKVNLEILKQASNSIFTDLVSVRQRQIGCVRYSYFASGSQLPPSYQCIFDKQSDNIKISNTRLLFTSERYGDPGYAQLDKYTSTDIFEGADNEQEMGAFNYLYQPQRISDLMFSLDEYVKFGMDVGIFLET